MDRKALITEIAPPDNEMFQMVDEPTAYLTTGWLPLDLALGGGIAIPKITIISGKWSSGKTTLALLAAISNQKMGGLVIFGNAERAPVKKRAAQLGVNIDEWVLFAPKVLDTYYDHPELKRKEYEVRGFFDIVTEQVIKAHKLISEIPILVILDSVTMAPTARERQGKGGRGEHARVMGSLLRGFNQILDENNAGLILINHLTTKQGQTSGKGTTFLAEAQQSGFAVCCVELEAKAPIGNHKGQVTQATITKNKLTGVEVYSLQLPIYLKGGVPYEQGCIEFLASQSTRKGYIKCGGKWLGKQKAKEKLVGKGSKRFRQLITTRAEKELRAKAEALRAGDITLEEGE